MSEDQGDKPTRHYIKQLERMDVAPSWVVYEPTPVGPRAVCLCYDESTAQRIMGLLVDAEARLPAGLDDTGII